MTPNEYQLAAARTLSERPQRKFTDHEIMIIWCALGMAGEVGECADYIKKGIFHEHGINVDILEKELGDCLWYMSCLAFQFGIKLEDVMIANIKKLEERYPNGFSVEASINRPAH